MSLYGYICVRRCDLWQSVRSVRRVLISETMLAIPIEEVMRFGSPMLSPVSYTHLHTSHHIISISNCTCTKCICILDCLINNFVCLLCCLCDDFVCSCLLYTSGMLLYSTCTFSPLEDEQIVSRMLKEDPDLELVEPEWYEGFDHGHPEWSDNNQELTKCVRIWPHRMKGEGHFLALLKKKGESSRCLLYTSRCV